MADPFSLMATAALVGGTALSATSQIMKGREESTAAAFERQQLLTQQEQYKIQEGQQRTAAMQDETRRRNELTSNLETIQAMRAGRGVGLSSPTGMAILDSVTEGAEGDIRTSRLNFLERADSARIAGEYSGGAAVMAGRKARMSLISGYLGAASTVASAGFKYWAATTSPGGGGARSSYDPSRAGALY